MVDLPLDRVIFHSAMQSSPQQVHLQCDLSVIALVMPHFSAHCVLLQLKLHVMLLQQVLLQLNLNGKYLVIMLSVESFLLLQLKLHLTIVLCPLRSAKLFVFPL